MEKQDVPNKENIIAKAFSFFEFFIGSFFYAFIYLAIGFSLLISVLYLYNSGYYRLANLGDVILMFLIKFWIAYVLVIMFHSIYKIVIKSNQKQKENFIQGRIKIKEELKQEILKEINGRRK